MSIENAILTLAEAINNLASAASQKDKPVHITLEYPAPDLPTTGTYEQCSGGCDKEQSPAPAAIKPEPEAPAAEPAPEPEKEAVEVTFDVLAKLVTDIVAKKGESIKPTIKAMIAKTGSAGLKLVAPEHYADLHEELLTLAD